MTIVVALRNANANVPSTPDLIVNPPTQDGGKSWTTRYLLRLN
jgi:hypothetical protein